MIIRLTSKMSKKLGVAPVEALPADENPLADWTAHVFRAGRLQYILVTNTRTLYSVVMLGGAITTGRSFLTAMASHLEELLPRDGIERVFQQSILPATADVTFSKNANRSLTGSMNDLALMAKSHILDGDLSLLEVSKMLNEAPMSYLDYQHSSDAFRSLAIEPEAPAKDTRLRPGRLC